MAKADESLDPVDWWSSQPPPPVETTPPATGPGDPAQGFPSVWAPGATAPSNAPPGYHWDATLAMYVADTAPTLGGGDPSGSNSGSGTAPAPIGVPTSGFGAAPAPYVSNADAPAYTPMAPYVPPTWTGGDYQNPTEADLIASPGYQARLDRRLQGNARQYAAQGTILNGGTLKALDRSAQDYASNEYQNLRNNTYDAYVQKYKQFTDAAGMDLNARTVNANENQNTFANRTASYLTGNARTLSDYLTNLTAKRNSELDYWSRLQDVNGTGASLAGGSR